jgi:Na+/phosphate symporter
MDLSVPTLVISSVLAVVGISISIAALDEAKRAWLFGFWKRWTGRAFIAVMIVNSVLGIFLFWGLKGAPARGEILVLAVHAFNLCAAVFIIFMAALEKALVARNAKRTSLEETVKKLERQVEALTSFKAMPATVDNGKRS